jgi:hypothetical protein
MIFGNNLMGCESALVSEMRTRLIESLNALVAAEILPPTANLDAVWRLALVAGDVLAAWAPDGEPAHRVIRVARDAWAAAYDLYEAHDHVEVSSVRRAVVPLATYLWGLAARDLDKAGALPDGAPGEYP